MEKNLIVLMIIAIIVFVAAIVFIFFVSKKNKLKSLSDKIAVSEKSISESLKNKLDIITRIINIIERELKIESKTFEEVKKVKIERINYIVLDNILTDASKEITELKSDYKELSKIKSFDGLVKDIKDLDIYISGGRKFYNKYTKVYNSLIKTFPSTIIAKSKKLTHKNLYTENIFDEDLKIGFTK